MNANNLSVLQASSAASALLRCHPSTPCPVELQVTVELCTVFHESRSHVRLKYVLQGELDRVRWPEPEAPDRTDGLWHHTCFEAFVGVTDSPAYEEFNFCPSSQWAHYRFSSERTRALVQPQATISPTVTAFRETSQAEILVYLPFGTLPTLPADWGLSAVVELDDGSLTYWALQHVAAQPDFHHPSARTLIWPQSSA